MQLQTHRCVDAVSFPIADAGKLSSNESAESKRFSS
jgi:hypothetical protein